jgi:hypothetical protein
LGRKIMLYYEANYLTSKLRQISTNLALQLALSPL